MTINIDKEVDNKFFEVENYEDIIKEVVNESLDLEECQFEVELNIILTDNDAIKEINKQYRDKDMPTDVLSFPMIEFDDIGKISEISSEMNLLFNGETGELILGDIIISLDKLVSQAHSYNHSQERELGFLIAHSMLHLMGYDHLVKEEEEEMKYKQELILSKVGLKR